MTELTDSDYAAIERLQAENWGSRTGNIRIGYEAGKRAGRLEGIAEGVKDAVQMIADTPCFSDAQGRMYLSLMERIRALASAEPKL